MRRRVYILVAAGVVLIAALTIGLTVANAQEEPSLPPLTPAELMAAMAEQGPQVPAVSGEFSWTNNLLGATVFESFHGGGGSDDPALDLLTRSGSGRVWLQGSSARLESQGRDGDTALYVDDDTLWVYDSRTDTATEYTLPHLSGDLGDPAGLGWKHDEAAGAPGAPGDPDQAAGLDLPARIQQAVDELAPTAALTVEQGRAVAGRAVYVLSMTPSAPNTVVDSVQVAVDGETFIPLRLEVFAKGEADAVLSAGFTSISYDAIDESVFVFTPPADATVEQKEFTPPDPAAMSEFAEAHPKDAMDREPLTLAEAQAEAGFTLMTPTGSSLAFEGAWVIPAHELPADAFAGDTGDPGAPPAGDAMAGLADAFPGGLPTRVGPVVVLAYGDGFGTVLLVQAENPAGATGWAALTAALSQVPVLGEPSQVGDSEAFTFDTSLGSAALWQRDGRVLVAAGLVSGADLASFAAGVR